MIQMLTAAKAAKRQVCALSTEEKNAALNAMADALLANQDAILAANELDMAAAKGTVSDVMLDRLQLTSAGADHKTGRSENQSGIRPYGCHRHYL